MKVVLFVLVIPVIFIGCSDPGEEIINTECISMKEMHAIIEGSHLRNVLPYGDTGNIPSGKEGASIVASWVWALRNEKLEFQKRKTKVSNHFWIKIQNGRWVGFNGKPVVKLISTFYDEPRVMIYITTDIEGEFSVREYSEREN